MSMLLNFVNSVVRDEEGQDLLEYALLVALIALVAIGAVGLAGNSVSTIFTNIAGRLTAAAGAYVWLTGPHRFINNKPGALPQAASHGRCIYLGGGFQMSMLLNFAKSVVRNEEGQDLLEYALLVALIALVAIGAVGLAGNSVSTIFTNIATQLSTAGGA